MKFRKERVLLLLLHIEELCDLHRLSSPGRTEKSWEISGLGIFREARNVCRITVEKPFRK
jgi:hypothetical protein